MNQNSKLIFHLHIQQIIISELHGAIQCIFILVLRDTRIGHQMLSAQNNGGKTR